MDAGFSPVVYVLAPVHNRRAITERFVQNLLAQTYERWHLVLIDDGSTDGTADAVRILVPSLTVITGKGNWWWGGSLQQGFKWLKRNRVASNDIVLIMNDDTEFEPRFIAAGVKALAPNSLLLAQLHSIHSRSFEEVGARWDWGRFGCAAAGDISDVNCFATRGLFLHFRDMEKAGGFRPFLLPHYLSDYEFTIRAHRRGMAFTSSPDVKIWYDMTTTGNRELPRGTLTQVLRGYFSKRSTSNPVYLSVFAVLCSPGRFIPRTLLMIWRDFARGVRGAMREAYAMREPSK